MRGNEGQKAYHRHLNPDDEIQKEEYTKNIFSLIHPSSGAHTRTQLRSSTRRALVCLWSVIFANLVGVYNELKSAWGSDKPELAHTSQIDESDVHLLEKMLNTSLKNFIILFFAGFALPVYSVSIPTLHLGASTLDLTNGSEQLTKRRTISNAALIDGDQYKCHLRCLPHRPANPPNRGCDTADRCRKAGEQVSWQGQFFRESPVALPYPSLTTLSFICFDRPSLRSGAVLTRCDDLVITTPCPLRGWCLCLYVSGADFLRNRLSCFNFKKNKHKFSICAIRTLLLHNTPDYIQL